MDFVNRLRPEHLSSFWYFPSKVNFALIATFGSLLLATAPGQEEADFYRTRLVEYRWTLCVSSKCADFLSFAVDSLDTSSLLLRSLPSKPSTSKLLHTISRRLPGSGPRPGPGPGPGPSTKPALTAADIATTATSKSSTSSSSSPSSSSSSSSFSPSSSSHQHHQRTGMILSNGTTLSPSSSRGDGIAQQLLVSSSSAAGFITYTSKGDTDVLDQASSPSSPTSASSRSGSTTYDAYR